MFAICYFVRITCHALSPFSHPISINSFHSADSAPQAADIVTTTKHPIQSSYVALVQVLLAALMELFAASFKNDHRIYLNGNLKLVIESLGIAMSLKYDCCPQNDHHTLPSLEHPSHSVLIWKSAAQCFQSISKNALEAFVSLKASGLVDANALSELWRHLLDAIQGTLLSPRFAGLCIHVPKVLTPISLYI